MTTANQKPPTLGQIAAATMLAAGTLTAGALGPAAPAQAAGTFLALAYQPSYEVDCTASSTTFRPKNTKPPTTLTARRPSRRRLNNEAGIKPGTVQTSL
jgi:hypothetical protein